MNLCRVDRTGRCGGGNDRGPARRLLGLCAGVVAFTFGAFRASVASAARCSAVSARLTSFPSVSERCDSSQVVVLLGLLLV